MRVYSDWFKIIHIEGTFSELRLRETEAVSLISMMKDESSADRMAVCKNSVIGIRNKDNGMQIYKEEYMAEEGEYREISVYLKKNIEESFIYNIEKVLKDIGTNNIENINKAQEIV